MTFDLLRLLHAALFGALAASGFGILFNEAFLGALPVAPWLWRHERLGRMPVGLLKRIVYRRRSGGLRWAGIARSLGYHRHCFSRLRVYSNGARELRRPGNFGLFGLTASQLDDPGRVAITTMEFTLRVIFTIGAIGAGLSMATHIFRSEFHD